MKSFEIGDYLWIDDGTEQFHVIAKGPNTGERYGNQEVVEFDPAHVTHVHKPMSDEALKKRMAEIPYPKSIDLHQRLKLAQAVLGFAKRANLEVGTADIEKLLVEVDQIVGDAIDD